MERSDQFKPVCPQCGSDGWRYVHPVSPCLEHQDVDYLEVPVVFAQAGLNPDLFQVFGGFDFGDALMTAQAAMAVGFRDRFVGIDQVMPYTELLTRGEVADAEVPVGKTGRSSQAQQTAMRYEPVRINYVADDDGEYEEGTDFRLIEPFEAEPAKLKWIAGRGPDEGVVYAVHYTCHPVWIVNEATYAIQSLKGPERGMKGVFDPRLLPTTWKVKLDFLTPARGS
tara:strand:- start:5940 stop:6614 length:675 start_codon:yes stop_codon:yes gene_type:complete